MSEQNTFIKGLVFRLVKKHIAGATLNSAFKTTKALENKGIPTTITFLNECDNDAIKARYNVNLYIQLIKQISRLNLKSSISIRLSQIGLKLPNNVIDKNMEELINVAKNSGIIMWIESENGIDFNSMIEKYQNYSSIYNKIGIELPLRNSKIEEALTLLEKNSDSKYLLKLTTYFYGNEEKKDVKTKENPRKEKLYKNTLELYSFYIDKLLNKGHSIFILEHDEKTVYKLAELKSSYKKNLIFELPLGYSKKWQSKFIKRKINISVYVPYGKDWVSYAINNLTEGRIRELAISLLEGSKKKGNVNGEKSSKN
ncbi:MAG: proline dehydrogenase family protein [Candidatus Marsarchaeota archaeon]|jgi:proline dehydrogenase|nr:proline dehydrogenase family protein [Candidatus Marsarchaeota archaeon]